MSNKTNIFDMAKRLSLANLASRQIAQIDRASEEELNFLEQILTEELYLRGKKKRQAILTRSRLLEEKTFAQYNLKFQPSLTKWHIEKLKETEWIDKKFNVIIVGEAGTGKSHIATAIGYSAVGNDKKVFYTTLRELLVFNATKEVIKASKVKINYLKECDLIIIDEFGYTPITKEESLWVYNLLNDLNKVTSIVIVTNRIFSKWKDIFTDEVIAATLIDRITEKCQILKLSGDSYRLANHEGIVEIKRK